MKRAPAGRRGFTLVELLVALAVLSLVGGALAALQVGALRTSRTAQVRHLSAALMSDELVAQRLLAGAGAGDCLAVALPDGWSCRVSRWCLAPAPGCTMALFEVELTPSEGEPLVARGARYEPLLGRP